MEFPKTRKDGTFSFDAVFALEPGHGFGGEQFAVWLADWKTRSSPWVREWSSGKTEVLKFENVFDSVPELVDVNSDSATLRFKGKADRKIWKEWFVRLSGDLIREQASVTRLDSCKDSGPDVC